MDDIKIQFLGTGNAVPTKLRNHTGILVSFANENILVDCGENIQRQFRIAKISPTKLTKILITHWHGDHILGLPGLFQTLAMSNYQGPIHLYGPQGSMHYFQAILDLLRGLRLRVEIHEISQKVFFTSKNFELHAESMDHGTPTLGYSIVLKDRIRLDKKKLKKLKLPNSPLLGQLQSGKNIVFEGKKISAKSVSFVEKGKKLSIVLDTAFTPNAISLAKDSDLLISESTFASEEEEKAKEYLHLTATQAATIAKKSKSKKLILTHISERYEHNPQILLKEAKKTFKNSHLVKDFEVIKI